MELPLTPLDFARRARKRCMRIAKRVVDGAPAPDATPQFFDRCDRWSAALQRLGVGHGRSRRLHRAEHARHARVVLRRAADRRGARADQLPADRRRLRLHDQPQRRDGRLRARRLSGARSTRIRDRLAAASSTSSRSRARATGWLDYEALLAATRRRHSPARRSPRRDLLTINYTSGTTSRPKGVMITHRNAWMNAVGTLVHMPHDVADRYLWTLPMFHANGWTFVWIVTAVGGTHVCLRKVEPAAGLRAARSPSGSRCCAPRRRC